MAEQDCHPSSSALCPLGVRGQGRVWGRRTLWIIQPRSERSCYRHAQEVQSTSLTTVPQESQSIIIFWTLLRKKGCHCHLFCPWKRRHGLPQRHSHQQLRLPEGQCWNMLLRQVVEFPSLEILKSWLNIVLGNLSQPILLWTGWWTTRSQEVPSHINHSVKSSTRTMPHCL